MICTQHEIGSGNPPRAAEVEPPASMLVIPAGGSADQSTSYVTQRLSESGLRLVSGSATMRQDEFARFEAAGKERMP